MNRRGARRPCPRRTWRRRRDRIGRAGEQRGRPQIDRAVLHRRPHGRRPQRRCDALVSRRRAAQVRRRRQRAQGPAGNSGTAGPQGAKGDTGAAGAQGPRGVTGADGAVGAKGDTGADGAAGPQGPQGDNGPAGAIGPAGPQGSKGDTGAPGPVGATGATGPQGDAGANGLGDGTTTLCVSNGRDVKFGGPGGADCDSGHDQVLTVVIVKSS